MNPRSLRSLRFSKNFFWFNDEAVDPQQLSTYLRGEKPEIGHPTAAYASQTGKGLMFFAKRAEDKPQPSGILNLVSLGPENWKPRLEGNLTKTAQI